MNVQARLSFVVTDVRRKERIDQELKRLHLEQFIPPLPADHHSKFFMQYEIRVDYNPESMNEILDRLDAVREEYHGENPEFSFEFVFSDSEYNDSPLYHVHSIGNNPALYKYNILKYRSEVLCDTCGISKKIQREPIVMNTAIFKKHPLIIADRFWVISEPLAKRFQENDLTGFELNEVQHKGKEWTAQRAYQVIPLHILPKQTIPLHFSHDPYVLKQKCPKCNLGGHLSFPPHYDETVRKCLKDFNLTEEYYTSGKTAFRRMLISSKVKSILKDCGIVKNEMRNARYWGEDDWVFVPVIVN